MNLSLSNRDLLDVGTVPLQLGLSSSLLKSASLCVVIVIERWPAVQGVLTRLDNAHLLVSLERRNLDELLAFAVGGEAGHFLGLDGFAAHLSRSRSRRVDMPLLDLLAVEIC